MLKTTYNKNQKHNLKVYKKNLHLLNDPQRWYGPVEYFKCVKCGGYATFLNFEFCGSDPLKVKCYSCQNEERKNNL